MRIRSQWRVVPAVFLLFTLVRGGVRAADQCLVCHSALGDTPSAQFRRDIHFQKGVTCAGCHGGNAATDDMERAMDSTAGFIGVPKGNAISERCARCHGDPEAMRRLGSGLPTDQYAALQQSVHGKSSTTGGERIAQCTTCHRAHGIVSVRNPASPVYPLNVPATCASCHSTVTYLRTYNPSLPVDQLEKYRTSVHGMRNAKGDPKVAECASCHGSHDILSSKDVRSRVYPTNIPGTCSSCHSNADYMKPYGIRTDQFEKFAKSVHGVALLQKNDIGAPACNKCHGNHGAVPPGVESISKVCGTCHALNADLFAGSPHKKAFDDRKLPECETCHGNHEIIAASDQLLGTSTGAVCTRCHSPSERPRGYEVARTMRALFDSLEASEAHAASLVDESEQKGMEIEEAKFKLRDARQARLQARTMVHSFDEGTFRKTINEGFSVTAMVTAEAQQALDEFVFRRLGLGIATLIITILVITLYVLIRRLERRPRDTAHMSQSHTH